MNPWKRKEVFGNATLYLGDCREILPTLGKVDAVITDPPWDAAVGIPGADDPRGLFAAAAPLMTSCANQVVVQLGCDTDPVFLGPLASLMPFLRVCWLEYACPSYKGRLLHTGDVAYVYGSWPPARQGATVIPGKCVSTRSDKEFLRGPRPKGKEKGGWEKLDHPMPRRSEHVRWLVKWFSNPDGTVCDPFMGSGTTGVVCCQHGQKFIGIEIKEEFFNVACERIENAQRQKRLFA